MTQPEKITLVLRAPEGGTLEHVLPFAKLGAHVCIGRSLAVIAGASEGDLQLEIDQGAHKDFLTACAGLEAGFKAAEPFNIDEHVRMAANAKRYEWLRSVAFDTPRQDLVPRDRLGDMLIEQDLDGEIDRAMKAYPGEQEETPCAD